MDELHKARHNEYEEHTSVPLSHIGKMKKTVYAIGLLGLFILAVSTVQAFSGSETPQEKLQRLERDYTNQVEITNRADEVIEKQYDIKARAELTRQSLTVELAALKTQIELEKEDPNMAEIDRLNKASADALSNYHASSLGK